MNTSEIRDTIYTFFVAVLVVGASALFIAGCTVASLAPTSAQVTVANAVEDAIAIGLVPVLTKNPTYLGAARAVAASLGSFSGDTLTPADVDAFLAKAPNLGGWTLAPDDARVIAGVVNAAWQTYAKRYAAQVNASVRPDVKLFLSAVAEGINRAIAAVPK